MGVVLRMTKDKPKRYARALLLFALPVLAILAAGMWIAIQFIEAPPPARVSIAAATKGSPYYVLAERYKAYLAKNGVTLDIRETGGSFDNLKMLTDPAFGVGIGFLQGGIAGEAKAAGLRSLGRVMYEPLWVFAHVDSKITNIASMAGKRILVGPAGGGTENLARRMLEANEVTSANAQLVNMELPAYVDELESGKADAGFLVLAAGAKTIQRLFASPHVKLIDLSQAAAYAERYPFLSPLVLKQGIINFAQNIPPADTNLVATRTALVIREDLHPAIANLLTQALVAVHNEPDVNGKGEAAIFVRTGEFPMQSDPEFVMSEQARRVYRSGAPLLQRYLPFGLATLIDRLLVLAVPLLGVLLPVVKFAPMIYTWQVRQRLLYWYKELKRVERGVASSPTQEDVSAALARIEEIEDTVNGIPIPLAFTNQLYDLRAHIDVVRRKLGAVRVHA